jgi:hypothetical protein
MKSTADLWRTETWKQELEMIVDRIQVLTDANFARHLDLDSNSLPWDLIASRSFYELAQCIAQEDPTSSWDSLLTNGLQRTYLIRGMILKAIEVKVFCEPLFGADDVRLQSIQARNPVVKHGEGFHNARIRAENVVQYLEEYDAMSESFWAGVDSVTTDILTLLLPLYGRIEKKWIDFDGTSRVRDRGEFHEMLHDVVAASAWVSISMRAREGISHWTWPTPGNRRTWNQVNADEKLYKTSQEYRAAAMGMKNEQNRTTARVKIAITPEISDHSLGYHGAYYGTRNQVLFPPMAVYYAGDAAGH